MFARRLNMLRKENNISQMELAKQLGVSQSTVGMWETGKRHPDLDMLQQIAHFFEVTEDLLLRLPKNDDNNTAKNIISVMNLSRIPVLGVIRAGLPILAEENITHYENADVTNPDDYFYLTVTGDSMCDAGIFDGSLVLIHKQNYAENNQIVACILDEENATLKRYKQRGDVILLHPENKSYQPIILNKEDFDTGYVRIIGVAKQVMTKL